MASRSHVDAVLSRTRAELARGPLSDAERVAFDQSRALEMHQHERRRHPERFAEQLLLPIPTSREGA